MKKIKDVDMETLITLGVLHPRQLESEPALYHALTCVLTDQQQKQLNTIFVLADQRKAQQDSKRIEQSGGYSFTVPAQVPTTFKFGS
ncbi:jg16996 [Pararge aegeria aegeria]|uniref:Jg16996 protein n=1 Tax=Pararge aegeria aegeria TaxID=348720 RepID=A0A8S4R747_9NEOP|nr:jg16996 [Pararge aegeria aegeria]